MARLLTGKAKQICEQMQPWFDDINCKRKPAHDGRTVAEQCFDSGVLVAAEFVRRFTGDERLASLIHEACLSEYQQGE